MLLTNSKIVDLRDLTRLANGQYPRTTENHIICNNKGYDLRYKDYLLMRHCIVDQPEKKSAGIYNEYSCFRRAKALKYELLWFHMCAQVRLVNGAYTIKLSYWRNISLFTDYKIKLKSFTSVDWGWSIYG